MRYVNLPQVRNINPATECNCLFKLAIFNINKEQNQDDKMISNELKHSRNYILGVIQK